MRYKIRGFVEEICGIYWNSISYTLLHVTLYSCSPQNVRRQNECKKKIYCRGNDEQLCNQALSNRLTQKLWLWLWQLGGGLSKHKWAVDKGVGGRGGGGRRLGSLFKYRGRGSSWEKWPRLNGIQYGTQPVTCKHGHRGCGNYGLWYGLRFSLGNGERGTGTGTGGSFRVYFLPKALLAMKLSVQTVDL